MLLTIILICLLLLIITAIAVFMTKCRKQLGGKTTTTINDPSSIEEGQTLVPHQTAETKLV